MPSCMMPPPTNESTTLDPKHPQAMWPRAPRTLLDGSPKPPITENRKSAVCKRMQTKTLSDDRHMSPNHEAALIGRGRTLQAWMPRELESNGRGPFDFQAKGPFEYARGPSEYSLRALVSTRLDPAAAANIPLYIITLTPVHH
ncbi:hypothetical protein SVAN01_04121 [Stagonosporopsis vannaccii]|nr:hypothetical protein SVAN01_04121 [Stagonosporopsis vannaccii]